MSPGRRDASSPTRLDPASRVPLDQPALQHEVLITLRPRTEEDGPALATSLVDYEAGRTTSMLDEHGDRITDEQAIARVARLGSVVVHRSHVAREDLTSWRRRLRALARERERGLRISVRKAADLTYVLHNPDHVTTAEQLRAAVSALPVPAGLAPPALAQPRPVVPPRRPRVIKDH